MSAITARKFRTSGRSDIYRATGLRITDDTLTLPNGSPVGSGGGGDPISLTGDITGTQVDDGIVTAIGAAKVGLSQLKSEVTDQLGGGAGITLVRHRITLAQLLLLNSVPLDAVTAQGAGLAVVPLFWHIRVKNTTGFGAGYHLRLRWAGLAYDAAAPYNNALFFGGNQNALGRRWAIDDEIDQGSSDIANKTLQIISSADTTGGSVDAYIIASVAYYVLDLTNVP